MNTARGPVPRRSWSGCCRAPGETGKKSKAGTHQQSREPRLRGSVL